jgi:mannosyltransferase OCH1-like enzyme
MNICNIPKIIHHIAPLDKSNWHHFWFACYDSWKNKFPSDYKFLLWNDQKDLDFLVKQHYPRYWNLYQAFPVHIMKIDFARMCILHKYGGIYADMDVFCYKNFENYLKKDIYFLENLTCEYTDARWENSMMSSIPNHTLWELLMKYTQTCFIHYRNSFNKHPVNWRNTGNDKIVNNTTGSGMISEAIKHYAKYFDVGVFECELFNNRPMSYSDLFYTKHVHTSIWGSEYTKSQLDRLLLINGCAYATGELHDETVEMLKDKFYQIVMNENFDFYTDYTNGVYLKTDNLDQIKTIVACKH